MARQPDEKAAGGGLSRRQRLLSGIKAQVFANVVRVVVQLGGIVVLLPFWGLQEYGEWLILTAVPTAMAFSDLGFFAATRNDMVMAVARGEHGLARDVFRATARGTGLVFLFLALLLPLLIWNLPMNEWLNVSLPESDVAWALSLLVLNTLLITCSGLINGGFASAGYYGAGAAWRAGLILVEFLAIVVAVLLTRDPVVAAGAMLITRVIGTPVMYVAMRRRIPWLSLGRPVGRPQVLKRLTKPAIAAAAFPTALALNIQGTIVLVGIAAGPVAVAVFGAVRTVSRVVVQAVNSVSVVVGPELAKAYAEGDEGAVRSLNRRACRASLWLAGPILILLAALGDPLIRIWTGGSVDPEGALLPLLLIGTGIGSLWYTSLAILISTNRHQRVSALFLASHLLALPLTYLFVEQWGIEGAALALALLEAFMLVVVLRQSLPATYDRLAPWLRAIVRPPDLIRRW